MGRVGGRSAQLKGGCVWVIVQLLTEWPECAMARLYKCSFGDLCGYLIRCQGRLVGGGACVLRRNISDTYLVSDSPVT